MNALAVMFAAGEKRIMTRLEALADRLDTGEDCWAEYLAALVALKQLVGETREPLLTTKEAAEKFGVSPRTIRKRGKKLGLEAVRLGRSGTAAIRWRRPA